MSVYLIRLVRGLNGITDTNNSWQHLAHSKDFNKCCFKDPGKKEPALTPMTCFLLFSLASCTALVLHRVISYVLIYQHFLEIGQTNTLSSIDPWFLTTTMKIIMILVRIMRKWTLFNHFILTTHLHVHSLIGDMPLASHLDQRREGQENWNSNKFESFASGPQ